MPGSGKKIVKEQKNIEFFQVVKLESNQSVTRELTLCSRQYRTPERP
jgi:hypothetical protein